MILCEILFVCIISIAPTSVPFSWIKLSVWILLPPSSISKAAPPVLSPNRTSSFPDSDGSHNSWFSKTSLHAILYHCCVRPLSSISTLPLPLRTALLALVAIVLTKQYRRILWPRSRSDPLFSEPLPPGGLGCPFYGKNVLGGDAKYGIGSTYQKIWISLGNPQVFKAYFLGSPIVVVTGSKNIHHVLKKEFFSPGVANKNMKKQAPSLFGTESLRNVTNKKEHSFLRRLMGQAMTPSSISKSVPALQQAATYHVTKLLESQTTKMIDVCHTFTLDVAWKQILGLKLNETEVVKFHEAVIYWTGAVLSQWAMFLPGIRFNRAYKARTYLEKLIEAKIEDLEQSGPDGSTLSAMVFATDDNGTGKRLTSKQLIDNSLFLIFAGTETSARTLTTAMLFLGLHPDSFAKVKEEQRDLISKHGEVLTKVQLDNECPYLTAVIKETMRIKTFAGIPQRIAKDTIVVDGKQIPKGWAIINSIQITHMNDPKTFKEDGSHMDIMQGYKPERWLDEKTCPKTEYMPFGYGYRFCLGANLALTEMKIFLAIIARKIDFNVVSNKDSIKWNPRAIIPTPSDGTVIAPRISKNV